MPALITRRDDVLTCLYIITIANCGKPIKIGISTNPHSRLVQLQAYSPAKLAIATMRAFSRRSLARQAELLLHNRLKKYQIHGEWYDITAIDAWPFLQKILQRYKK